MFCPNCGTQNPETATTCTKCGFNLKGAAAPKFKGTMLMMNQPGAPKPGAPVPGPAAAASPRPAMKGTIVGVAPPSPGAAAPPEPTPGAVNPMGSTFVAEPGFPIPGGGPPADQGGFGGPPGGGGFGGPPPGGGGFGGPPPQDPGGFGGGGGFGGPPPGGGFGGPPPQDPGGFGGPPPGGGFGGPPPGGGFGGPPPNDPGGFGGPPPGGGFGGPPPGGGFGGPPPNDPGGFGGAPPGGGGFGGPPPGGGGGFGGPPPGGQYGPPPGGQYGAPPQDQNAPMGYGAPPAGANLAVAPGGGPMGMPGVTGLASGKARNPMTITLISVFCCFYYGLFQCMKTEEELNKFCGKQQGGNILWMLFPLIPALGMPALIAEARARAQTPTQGPGSLIMYIFLPYYQFIGDANEILAPGQKP